MPKSRGKRQQERENWSWNGFVAGAFFGLLLVAPALGHSENLLAIMISRFVIAMCFLVAVPLTAYNFYYKKAWKSTFWEGVIMGIGWTAQIIELIILGIHFP